MSLKLPEPKLQAGRYHWTDTGEMSEHIHYMIQSLTRIVNWVNMCWKIKFRSQRGIPEARLMTIDNAMIKLSGNISKHNDIAILHS